MTVLYFFYFDGTGVLIFKLIAEILILDIYLLLVQILMIQMNEISF